MSKSQIPTLSDAERREAARKAVICRQKRSEVRKQLKEGLLTLSDVFAMEDKAILRMPVRLLLASLPWVGKAKSLKIMDKIGIAHNRRIGGLGSQQIKALLAFEKNRPY